MNILRIPGFTRLLGKSQGYLGLPIKDEPIDDPTIELTVNSMTSAWEPTPEELERLNKGASVHVRLIGTALCKYGTKHPPIMVEVGPIPE